MDGTSQRGKFAQNYLQDENSEIEYCNGDVYRGPVQGGVKEGTDGQYNFQNGEKYSGPFSSDQIDTLKFQNSKEGLLELKSGISYKGHFDKGVKKGNCEVRLEKGIRVVG